MPKPVYIISVDIECDGHIPGDYSMISLGACIVGDTTNNFYCEICPISNNFVPEALAVSGLNRERLIWEGLSPKIAMTNFVNWVNEFRKIGTVLFLAAPTSFDAAFLNYYFHKFVGGNSFGLGSFIDMRSYWYGKSKCKWQDTSKGKLKDVFNIDLIHTHNALDDAIEQAIYFENMLKYDNVLIGFLMDQLKLIKKEVVFREKAKTFSAASMLQEFRSKSKYSQAFLQDIKEKFYEFLKFDFRKKILPKEIETKEIETTEIITKTVTTEVTSQRTDTVVEKS